MQSMNAGAQSMSFASFNDVLNFYKTLKQNLLDTEALKNGTDTGAFFCFPPVAVGGQYQ
jgi:hypothetical protein